MNEIEISVKSLYKIAKQMFDDGMETVVISICDANGDGEDALPACISFEASTKEDPEIGVDYEEIEELCE